MANEAAPVEAPGPPGDALRHRSLDELARAFVTLPRAAADQGRLALIVSRRPDGVRDTPAQVRLTADDGVPGDRWQRRLPKNPEAQITVMRRDVAELIANGQPLTLFGDNLFVDLDLAAANLPPGTELRVGTAVVAVTRSRTTAAPSSSVASARGHWRSYRLPPPAIRTCAASTGGWWRPARCGWEIGSR
jgi:hypothetical protein